MPLPLATPGMHYPESRYCIRRVRISKHSELITPLTDIGYTVEQDVVEPNSVVVEIPIDHGEGVRGLSEVCMWEQLSLAAFLQRYWSDNQVSSTITLDPQTEGPHLEHALEYFQYQLKGISFLPRLPLGAYAQMPFEAISEERYEEVINKLKPLPPPSAPKPPRHPSSRSSKANPVDLRDYKIKDKTDPEMELFCDSTSCVIVETGEGYSSDNDKQ
jgi:ribonucleoside-triphosphate reductase